MASSHRITHHGAWRWLLGWHNVLPVLMILVLALGLDHHETQSTREANQQQLTQSLAQLRAEFEAALNSRLLLVRGLAALVKDRPGISQDEFSAFVRHLADQETRVRSLQWAPKAVVTHVYPLAGNEAAVGHDLLADPARRDAVEWAIHEGSFVVTGPFALRQGGVAIVARLPIYRDGDGDRPSRFLGFATVVVDMDAVYADVGLAKAEADLAIAIRGKDGLGERGEVFHGDAALFANPAARITQIKLPHGHWQIAASLRDPDAYRWHGRPALILVVLLAIATVLLLNRRARLSESALVDSEARLKEIAINLGEGIYVVDEAGCITYANPKASELLGWHEAELIGRHAPTLCKSVEHKSCRPDCCGIISRPLAGKAYRSEEVELLRQDGSVLPVELSSSPIARNGRVVGAVVAFNDISERKRAAAVQARNEERLREAQRVARLGNWELDIVADTLIWSDEVFEIFEIDPTRFGASYEAFLELVHPDDRDAVAATYRASLKNRRPYEATHRLLMDDGSVKYVLERCESFFDAEGKPLRSVGTVQDVTDQVLQEEALRESEERFRTIADYTYDWEYWIGPRREFLYISPSCLRITGYSQAQFISDPGLLERIVHPDDRQLMADHLGDLERTEDVLMEFRIVRQDGEVRWISHGCRPIYAKDGRFLGRRASNGDITDRKDAEARIQQLAYFDTLTDLPNRRMLVDRLNRALSQAKRFERSLAVMFLDLDHFKQINDTLGHDVGDRLLQEIARRLAACVRSGDTVSRQGGDEFVIVLAEIAHPDDAALVAEKIVKVVAEPVTVDDHVLHVTTSVGIAIYPVSGTDDAQEMMKKADQAMYAAKEAGRNGYRFFGSD